MIKKTIGIKIRGINNLMEFKKNEANKEREEYTFDYPIMSQTPTEIRQMEMTLRKNGWEQEHTFLDNIKLLVRTLDTGEILVFRMYNIQNWVKTNMETLNNLNEFKSPLLKEMEAMGAESACKTPKINEKDDGSGMKIYIASSFFDEATYEYTKSLADRIIDRFPNAEIYLPQENDDINDKENNDDNITGIAIAEADLKRLNWANILIPYIDGPEIDPGVASEIGYYYSKMEKSQEKRMIGLYTDMRQVGTGENKHYRNRFTTGLIDKCGVWANSREDMIRKLEEMTWNK